MRLLDLLRLDLRHAARSLSRTPAFTSAAVITLALGIGACGAVFSVVSATLLRPLPYRDPDRLVVLWQEYVTRGWGVVPVSHPNFVSIERQMAMLTGLAGVEYRQVPLRGVADPEMLVGAALTPGAFQVLGVDAALGRTLTEADSHAGADRVVVLSDGVWRRRFGADSGIVGRTIAVGEGPATVVGVMPRGFAFPPRFRASVGGTPLTTPAPDVWQPLALDVRPQLVGTRNLFVVARLAPGVALDQARAEAATLPPRLLQEFPGPANTGLSLALTPFHEQIAGDVRRPMLLLLAAVGLVVLVACANIASMLMARGLVRRSEMALRAAVGATRGDLVRYTLAESVLIAGAGGAVGVLLASWIVHGLSASIGTWIPHLQDVPIDGRVLAFTTLLALVVGLSSGVIPALRGSTQAFREHLSSPGLGQAAVMRSHGRVLVTAETALTLVLLAAAALFARSFYALTSVDPGFDPSRTTVVGFELPGQRYATTDQRRLFHQQLRARIDALPGVDAVGVTTRVPLSGGTGTGGMNIAGRPAPAPDDRPHAGQRVVDEGYFLTMGMRIVRGRGFETGDRPGAPAVAVINEAAARRYWSGEDPLGQRVQPDGVGDWLTIVGIVEDVRQTALSVAPEPEVYWPFAQRPTMPGGGPNLPIGIVVRATLATDNVAAAIRREVSALDSELPATIVTSLEDLVAESVAEPRLYTLTLGLFAAFSLVVAAGGLYGVLSFLVAQRRHEIGVRLALGAPRRGVLLLVLREGVAPVVAGVLIGLIATFAAADLIATQLYETSPTDGVALTAVPLLLLTVAVLACCIPAQRAARLDPVAVLRMP